MGTTRRVLARAAVTIVVACALSGCWPVPGQNPDATGHNPHETRLTPDTVAGLSQAWEWAPGAGAHPVRGPVVSPAGLHVTLLCGVATLRPADGSFRWRATVEPFGLPCQGPVGATNGDPFVVGDQVHVGSTVYFPGGTPPRDPVYLARTVAFDAATGAAVGSVPGASGALDARRGSVTAGDTGIAYRDPEDWMQTILSTWGVVGTPDGVRRLPTTVADRATVGQSAVFVTGLDASLSAYALSGPIGGCGPSGDVECPAWTAALDGRVAGRPVLGPGTVYVGTDAGTVHALDAAAGSTLWTSALGSRAMAPPALATGTLYVPTRSNGLAVLPATCGSPPCAPEWTGTVAGATPSLARQPAVAGGVVYAATPDGGLHAWDAAGCGAATCDPLWSGSAGAPLSDEPVVSGGRLYAATTDGRVVAFGLP